MRNYISFRYTPCIFLVYLISSKYNFKLIGRETIISKVSHIILADGTIQNINSNHHFQSREKKGKGIGLLHRTCFIEEHVRF